MEFNTNGDLKKAGAIILHPTDSQKIALIYRWSIKDRSFPKGHMESGENPLESCLREVKEETGLDVDVIKELPEMRYSNEFAKSIVIYMFLVKAKTEDFKLEHQDDRLEWVDIKDVKDRLSYQNLKDYFDKILPEIL